jgi:hypothetical protein
MRYRYVETRLTSTTKSISHNRSRIQNTSSVFLFRQFLLQCILHYSIYCSIMDVISPTLSKQQKLDSLRYWDVKVSPAEQKEIGGYMRPTLRGSIRRLGIAQKTRRITIETYRLSSDKPKAQESLDHSERNFNKLMSGESQNGAFRANRLSENEIVVFRVFEARAIKDDISISHRQDDLNLGKMI